jgi:hypothetical protein
LRRYTEMCYTKTIVNDTVRNALITPSTRIVNGGSIVADQKRRIELLPHEIEMAGTTPSSAFAPSTLNSSNNNNDHTDNNSKPSLMDMPLRRSNQTRTLLPGLRRKSSIRRPSCRSKWYSLQEQALQKVTTSFSLSKSSSFCIRSGTGSSNTKSRRKQQQQQQQQQSSSPYTQRILKYDPYTGTAYDATDNNNNNNNSNNTRLLCCTISNAVSSTKMWTIWKTMTLISFFYIHLHLFYVSNQHRSFVTFSRQYDQQHRSLRGGGGGSGRSRVVQLDTVENEVVRISIPLVPMVSATSTVEKDTLPIQEQEQRKKIVQGDDGANDSIDDDDVVESESNHSPSSPSSGNDVNVVVTGPPTSEELILELAVATAMQ